MLGIRKGPEPKELRVYRETTPGATYGGFRETKAVRDQLYADQGGLCAYCMRRVQYDPSVPKEKQAGEPDFTIEHWSAQSTSDRDLHWPDMLGVCDGRLLIQGRGELSCDKARGNTPIRLHPARDHTTIEAQFSYRSDGTLDSPGHHVDVNTTLNLNCRNLKHNRSLVFGEIVTKLGNADLTELKRQLSHWDARDQQGYRQEYAGVATFILRHAIKLRTQKAARLRKKPAS